MTDNGDAMDTCQTPRPASPKQAAEAEVKGLDDFSSTTDVYGLPVPQLRIPDVITLRSVDGHDFPVPGTTAMRFECIKAAIGGDSNATVVPFCHPSATKVNVELGLELLAAVGAMRLPLSLTAVAAFAKHARPAQALDAPQTRQHHDESRC